MAANITYMDRIAGNTIIQFTDIDPALLEVDAVVEEQDTNLLMGNPPVIKMSVESFSSLVKKMEMQSPVMPGTITVKQSIPKRFIAVVYDIEHNPISLQAWIEEALMNILIKCNKHKVTTLAMPLLGTAYGSFKEQEIIDLLQTSLIENRHQYPRKILIYKLQTS